MVRVRLSRGGGKKRPYYHIVVVDQKSKRDGRCIERIGSYDPNLENEKRVYKGILADIMEKSILLDQNKNLMSIELDKISDAKLLV